MDDAVRSLRTITTALWSSLVDRGLRRQADLLAELPTSTRVRVGQGQPLRVLEHLPAAENAAVEAVDPELAAAAVHLARVASWTQTPAYVDQPPHPEFLDQYAHATLAGPEDGTLPAPAGAGAVGGGAAGGGAAVAVGFVLLGPDVCYPAHRHPADEVYLPLGEARWLDESTGEYTYRAPGELIHHLPEQPHGMRTTGRPLLAVYCWTGNVAAPARFC